MKLLEYKGPYVYRAVFSQEQVDQESLHARVNMFENARYLAFGDLVIFEPAENGRRWAIDHERGIKVLQHFINGKWENVPIFWVD